MDHPPGVKFALGALVVFVLAIHIGVGFIR